MNRLVGLALMLALMKSVADEKEDMARGLITVEDFERYVIEPCEYATGVTLSERYKTELMRDAIWPEDEFIIFKELYKKGKLDRLYRVAFDHCFNVMGGTISRHAGRRLWWRKNLKKDGFIDEYCKSCESWILPPEHPLLESSR